jgi:tetratricopeptide (TPR) repeat protein
MAGHATRPRRRLRLLARRPPVGVTLGTVTVIDPLRRARRILDGRAGPCPWSEIQDLAHELAPSDRATAARLLVVASDVAGSAGQLRQAVALARAGVYLAGRFHPSVADEAGVVAVAGLERLTSPAEYFEEASQLAHAFTATGLRACGVKLARATVARAAQLPASEAAKVTHAQALSGLAAAYLRADQFQPALEAVEEARRVVPSDAYKVIGDMEFNEGLARASLDQIGPARQAYERSRTAFEIGGDDLDLAYVDRSEAAALARAGRYEEALVLFRRAEATFLSRDLTLEVEQTATGLVGTLTQLGHRWSDEELDRYEEMALNLPPAEALALGVNVANAAHNQQDAPRADRLYQQLAQMARDHDRPVDLARCEGSYAAALRQRGDLAGAWRANRAAAAAFEQAGLFRQLANANNNAALLVEELARESADPDEQRQLRNCAADYAIDSIVSLDAFRHSLPEAADRRALQLHSYPHIFTVAIAACMRAERWDELAAVVEKSRMQPVLAGDGAGYVEPAPLASRRGAHPVGGSGPPLVLSELAGAAASDGAGSWHGWWSDGVHLVRCRSRTHGVDAEDGELNQHALALFAAALPIVIAQDLAVAGGDPSTAQLLAIWRAASGPLLHDPNAVEVLELVLPASTRARLATDRIVASCHGLSADELLWPVATMLFADAWLDELRQAQREGIRRHLVVAPPPLLGRIPWAALPLTDPSKGAPAVLVEAAELLVGLPATLAAGLSGHDSGGPKSDGPGLVVADSLGDLSFARSLRPPGMRILGTGGQAPATRTALVTELRSGAALFILNAHVEPGSDDDPASSALLLRDPTGGIDRMRVADFAGTRIPNQCVILGCDGAGAATGTEWTGLATGLVWAGAAEVVTTTAPVVDDQVTADLDDELVDEIRRRGASAGLLSWQRRMARRRRQQPGDPRFAPYRWAQTVGLRTAVGKGQHPL